MNVAYLHERIDTIIERLDKIIELLMQIERSLPALQAD